MFKYDKKVTEYVLQAQKSSSTIHAGFGSTDRWDIYHAVKYYVDEVYAPWDIDDIGEFEGALLDWGMIAYYYGSNHWGQTVKTYQMLAKLMGVDVPTFIDKVKERMAKIIAGVDVLAEDMNKWREEV